MNKVTTFHLQGLAFQVEESGYDTLRAYLDAASASLQGNPDRDEILADIEQAIAEKFRRLLGNHKNVLTAAEISTVLSEMGPVRDDSSSASAETGNASTGKSTGQTTAANSAAGASRANSDTGAGTASAPKRPNRWYRTEEGAMIGGVCAGFSKFSGMSVRGVRFLFVLMALISWGVVGLIYLGLMFLLPSDDEAGSTASTKGPIPTAQDFIRRAREGYYEALRSMPDKEAHREWKRKFKNDMREWGRNVKEDVRAQSHNWREEFRARFRDENGALRRPWMLVAIFAPIVGLLFGALLLWGLFSQIFHGQAQVFHNVHGAPFWVWILLLIALLHLAFALVFLPFKLAFGACHCDSRRRCGPGPFGFLMTLALIFCAFWFFAPEKTKAFMDCIPGQFRKADASVREWWHRHEAEEASAKSEAATPAKEAPKS